MRLHADNYRLNAHENCQQLICAYELLRLHFNAVKSVADTGLFHDPSVDKITQLETKIAKMLGLGHIQTAFNKFVWKQLLKEGKVKDKEVSTETLKAIFTDLTVFLHYFARFSQPALKHMKAYRQNNPKGLPVALQVGKGKA